MRIGDSFGHEGIRRVIRLRSNTYTVTRQTGTEDVGMGETRPTTSTLDVDAYLYLPTETPIETEFGDRLDGDLNGVALPSADVEARDVYTHGGTDFVVTDVMYRPSNSDQQYQLFALEERHTDAS